MLFRIQVITPCRFNSCDFECDFDTSQQALRYVYSHAKRVGYTVNNVVISEAITTPKT